MAEELYDTYHAKLLESKRPAGVLYYLYCDVQEINPETNKKLIGMFGKAIKLYGKEVAFNATINLVQMDVDKPEHPDALFFYFCKKLYEQVVVSRDAPVIIDLKKQAEERESRRVPLDREWVIKMMTLEDV
jgi:hypothetical protein